MRPVGIVPLPPVATLEAGLAEVSHLLSRETAATVNALAACARARRATPRGLASAAGR